MEIMLNRKLICKPENTKIEQFIHQLQQTPVDLSHPIIQTILNSQHLTQYFHNLPLIINRKNLVIAKRYQVLQNGLYILLKGEISFMFCDQIAQRKVFVNESRNNMTNKVTSISRSILSLQLTVFQSEKNNCTALDESYLLKINEQQAVSSKFNDMFHKRRDLYQNHYLAYDHQIIYNTDLINNIFTNDMRIHSNTYFKTYSLRQIILLNSVGIISIGRAKLKIQHVPSAQFQKYGLLLPHVAYQVTSSDFQVMIIANNETLKYYIDIDRPIRKSSALKVATHKSCCRSIYNRKKRVLLQLNQSSPSYKTRESEKRQKQLIRITRQTEVYSVVSSFLCQKSLNFLKKQNNRYLYTQTNQKSKVPLLLFKIANIKSSFVNPSFANKFTMSLVSTPKNQRSSLCKTASQHMNDFKTTKQNHLQGQNFKRRHQTKIFSNRQVRQQNKTKSMFTINFNTKISDFNTKNQRGLQSIIQN